MDRTLWTYGDSWAKWDDPNIPIKTWPYIIAEKLGIKEENVVNQAWGGASIQEQSIELKKDLRSIKKGDVVIFEFTYPERQCFFDFNMGHEWCNNNIVGGLINSEDFTHKNMAYLEFVLLFRSELIIREFKNILPIFNYIELNIGADVRYWFLNMEPSPPSDNVAETLEQIFYVHNRIIEFPPKNKTKEKCPFSRYIYADFMIRNDKLRIMDSKKYDKIAWKKFKKYLTSAESDSHPDQRGHYAIAERIISSFPPQPSVTPSITPSSTMSVTPSVTPSHSPSPSRITRLSKVKFDNNLKRIY
jgi:hypothetical protein